MWDYFRSIAVSRKILHAPRVITVIMASLFAGASADRSDPHSCET
jgi:hypothetical protein